MVVAIAPGGYIYQQSCHSVTHYRAGADRDFVPRLDTAGLERSRGISVDLKSDPKAKFWDHEFVSPTYREVLSRRVSKYLNLGVE